MYVCLRVCHLGGFLKRPEGGIGSPRAGVPGGCQPPDTRDESSGPPKEEPVLLTTQPQASLCSPVCPGTGYVDQAGLDCFCPPSAGVKDACDTSFGLGIS